MRIIGRDTVLKNGGKTKWKEGKVFIEPLEGVEVFHRTVENPLRVLGTGEGCFKTLKEYCETIFGRVCLNSLFEGCVRKG
jgi:hypothetical protein